MIRCLSEHLGFLEWSASLKPHPHESVCGDSFLVKPTESGALICAMDGLGHGSEACHASEKAVEALSNFGTDDVVGLFSHCHDALKHTRGAVISLALIDVTQDTISWAGIGNIEALLVRPGHHEWLQLRGGIVGCRVPTIRASQLKIHPGDLMIMFSDGVDGRFTDKLSLNATPEELSEEIINRHSKGYDDALALVLRYYGPPPGGER